ncbi:hypothetical protein CKO31_01495 [Thiohalocapsa halophila]|uniref:DNA methylase adenine-specific domain-containing protein n=1 Tax=Thiohalocapsa halophila TaxID=69359 RepID=A0ABS1CBZ2_9GAMM|nr:hypothetical protein [Thiohalocapsa halophila]
MVRMLDPKPNERVLDPACGTGGFLAATVAHQLARYKRDTVSGADGAEPDTADALSAADAVRRYVQTNLFGCDFDPALVRATTMNLLMAAGDRGHVFHLDSLSFPQGHLDGLPAAKKEIPFGTIDVLMTNPSTTSMRQGGAGRSCRGSTSTAGWAATSRTRTGCCGCWLKWTRASPPIRGWTGLWPSSGPPRTRAGRPPVSAPFPSPAGAGMTATSCNGCSTTSRGTWAASRAARPPRPIGTF